MRRLLAIAGVLALAPTLAQAETFRLASIAAAAQPCHALAPDAPAGLRALHKLLSQRLGVDVLDCPVAGTEGAGQALASGQVDLALLDPTAYAVAGKVRAILTLRPKGGLSRTPVVVAARAASTSKSLADVRGQRVVFGGAAPYDHDLPLRALADQGAGPGYFSAGRVAGAADAAVGMLRKGEADVVALNADAWQRTCRATTPKDQPCGDLRILWRGRPRANLALAVRTDMPAQLRYRIVGVFVAMHLEAPDAFQAASAFAPGGEDFDAAEADALSPARAIP